MTVIRSLKYKLNNYYTIFMSGLYGLVKRGIRNPDRAARYVLGRGYRTPVIAATSRRPFGTHVLDKDWDVLIILDTCRVDALEQLENEYEFINGIDSITSVGGTTFEWLSHTFSCGRHEELSNLAYLTPHGWAEKILDTPNLPRGDGVPEEMDLVARYGDFDVCDAEDIGKYERIGRFVPNNSDMDVAREFIEAIPDEYMSGRAPPRFVTDRGIAVGRSGDFNRLILHYVQPHTPYLAGCVSEQRHPHPYEEDPMKYLLTTGDHDRVWGAYLDELRWVLNDIEIFLQNNNSENVVISADHGEAFGEWGSYGHYSGSLNPVIRQVPWVETSATDKMSYQPVVKPVESSDEVVEDNLKALGYM